MFELIFLVVVALVCLGIYLVNARKPRSASPHAAVPKIRGNGRFEVDVVGESFYRPALSALFPPRRNEDDDDTVEAEAELRLDDNNPHDANAVAVHIRGQHVGHLSKSMAKDFRESIKRDGLSQWRSFIVDASVYVPDDDSHYSISLDLPQK